ncbi:MAG: tetratricopeptide repeat protein [Bacteroidales bacterium]|nr:tetratricopeptide repeat protein [Bacteroidales bacterium]
MISADDIEKAKALLAEDKLEEAMSLLDKLVADKDNELKDEAYYVRGNAFRRGNHWKEAINNYTRAIELNPQSPAAAMKASCIEILDFFNKDMFNH